MNFNPNGSEGFRYDDHLFPLANDCRFNIEIHSTFGLSYWLVTRATARISASDPAATDFSSGLSGFTNFDIDPPFAWRDLAGIELDAMLDDDSDVSIYVGGHEFAERQQLKIFERREKSYLMEMVWHLPDYSSPISARGWFEFSGVMINVNDKVFGARLRELIQHYGSKDEIPAGQMTSLEQDIEVAANEILAKFAPNWEEEYLTPDNVAWERRLFAPKNLAP